MNLPNELLERSPISTISFAGFKANTYELSNSGWAISAQQRRSYHTHGLEVQLALKHECGISLISNGVFIEARHILKGLKMPMFGVMGVSIESRSTFIAPHSMQEIDMGFIGGNFTPVDTAPSYEKVDLGTMDFNDFCLFKPLKNSAEIYIPKDKVDEALSTILKLQEPEQREIRENRRKEKLRGDYADVSRGSNEIIQAQILSIA